MLEGHDSVSAFALQHLLEKAEGTQLKVSNPPLPPSANAVGGQAASSRRTSWALFTQNRLLLQYRGDANRIRETLALWKK